MFTETLVPSRPMSAMLSGRKYEGLRYPFPQTSQKDRLDNTDEFRQFLYVSLGSLAELDTQLINTTKLDYVTEDAHARLREKIADLRKMLTSLIKKLNPVH
jgi:hypothetical protein